MQAKSVVGLGGILLLASAEMLSVTPGRLPQSTTLAQSASPVAPPPDGAQQAVLNRYCMGCHNDKVKTGGFSLTGADVANVATNTDLWENVLRKLEGRQMPPIGRPRPDEATYESLASHLETSLDRIAAANPNPGRTETFRRLTRTEYRNAVRDLLSVDVEVESLLPPDDSSFGFDNVTVGNLSPTLMEKYLASAQKISRLAIGTSVRTPSTYVVTLPVDMTQEQHFSGLPLGTRGGTIFSYTFPTDGTYEFQVRLYRDRNEHVEGLGRQGRGQDSVSEQHELELTVDGKRVQVFTIQPLAERTSADDPREYDDADVDKEFNLRLPVKAGAHDVAAAFLNKPAAVLETVRQPYPVAFNMDRHPRQRPAVYSVTITGPFDSSGAGDTTSRRRIFTCRPATAAQEPGCAKRIISTLTRRAYRRPVTDEDLKTPLAFYEQGYAEGGFETGVETALRKILIAPEFLFRVEQDPSAKAGGRRLPHQRCRAGIAAFVLPLEQYSRRRTARCGGARETPRLQGARAAGAPHAGRLAIRVARRQLRRPVAVPPQSRRACAGRSDVPDVRRQSAAGIQTGDRAVLRERHPREPQRARFAEGRLHVPRRAPGQALRHRWRVRHAVQARDAAGRQCARRVAWTGQHSARDLYANRTSPVLRGKWVLENIIGTPPPAPPPGVPPLKEARSEDHVPTMRERMVEHRANPACSSCHMLMDPIGLSMENFDAIGRWRVKGEDGGPIDAAGGLPNGDTFESVTGLKQALLARPDRFVAAVTEKLLTFALGRGVEPYDRPAVRAIVRECAPR